MGNHGSLPFGVDEPVDGYEGFGSLYTVVAPSHIRPSASPVAPIPHLQQPQQSTSASSPTLSMLCFDSEPRCLQRVSTYIHRIKTLRHPFILRYVQSTGSSGPDSLDAAQAVRATDAQSGASLFLVVEPVAPLRSALASMSVSHIRLCLHQLVMALRFLHEECHLSHNNLCMSSLFVSEDATLPGPELRLGGMEFCTDIASLTVENMEGMPPSLRPPEDRKPLPRKDLPPESRDVWALGKLFVACLGEREADVMADLVESCTREDPHARPCLAEVQAHPFFSQSVLVNTVHFLRTIQGRSHPEKRAFFHDLAPRLACVPLLDVERIVLPYLLAPSVLLEPHMSMCLPLLLMPTEANPSAVLPLNRVQSIMLPFVAWCFKTRRRPLRMVVLQHLPTYLNYLSPAQLYYVRQEVLFGIEDKDSALVLATVDALLVLASPASSSCARNRGEKPGVASKGDVRFDGKVLLSVFTFADQVVAPALARLATKDVDASVRSHACHALVKLLLVHPSMRAGTVTEALCMAMGDEDAGVRLDAVACCQSLVDHVPATVAVTQFMPQMMPLLLDGDCGVRHAASHAMVECVSEVAKSVDQDPGQIQQAHAAEAGGRGGEASKAYLGEVEGGSSTQHSGAKEKGTTLSVPLHGMVASMVASNAWMPWSRKPLQRLERHDVFTGTPPRRSLRSRSGSRSGHGSAPGDSYQVAPGSSKGSGGVLSGSALKRSGRDGRQDLAPRLASGGGGIKGPNGKRTGTVAGVLRVPSPTRGQLAFRSDSGSEFGSDEESWEADIYGGDAWSPWNAAAAPVHRVTTLPDGTTRFEPVVPHPDSGPTTPVKSHEGGEEKGLPLGVIDPSLALASPFPAPPETKEGAHIRAVSRAQAPASQRHPLYGKLPEPDYFADLQPSSTAVKVVPHTGKFAMHRLVSEGDNTGGAVFDAGGSDDSGWGQGMDDIPDLSEGQESWDTVELTPHRSTVGESE